MTGLLTALTLAWRPFLDPLNLHDQWWALLLPLAFGISMVYKAVRIGDLTQYWRNVLLMTVQIVVAMILLGVATFLFVEVYVHWLVTR